MDAQTYYSDGSYTLFDEGCRGDVFAILPRDYAAPAWLVEYFDLATALREATKTCALQQGTCWVVRARDTLQRCGQRCGRGECEGRPPWSPGLAGAGIAGGMTQGGVVRREAAASWEPVASVSPEGVAVVKSGCVLPLWQRIFQNTQADNFLVQGVSETYQAAVRSAMWLADHEKSRRLVYGWGRTGKPVPMVYVDPGGLVRSVQTWDVGPVQVDRIDRFELAQSLAASRGASIMPFNM